MIKAQGRRLLEIFPHFLEKSASRHHSKFLFGDSEQVNVFRNYKNAMQSVENEFRNLGECMLPQEVIKDDVQMFQLARENGAGTKVFDLKMSDLDEMNFITEIIGDAPTMKATHTHNLDLASLEGSNSNPTGNDF